MLLRVFLMIGLAAYLAATGSLDVAAWSLSVLPFCAVNLLDEQRLTLNQLAKQEGINPSTVWRWSLRGVRGVKLETFSVGARRFTTSGAFSRFVAGTTAAAQGEQPQARTNRQREAAIARAEAELASS